MIDLAASRAYLRIDGTDQDGEITTMLTLARGIVGQYCPPQSGPYSVQDSRDAATLLVLGELWANREAAAADPLSPGVRRILDSVRGPTWA